MVLRHELQHCETMRQTMAIAGLLPAGEPPARQPARGPAGAGRRVPAGSFAMGAAGEGFSYDNERPRHEVAVDAFSIARLPVSNASWMHFSEGGGYVRREWWSDEGWAWKEEYDITHDAGDRRAAQPDAPACHVSWFEAEAFARAHDARLPTEAEWERAATSTQGTRRPSRSAAGRAACGSGPPPPSPGYPASAPTPTASTRRSSSARLPRPARRLLGHPPARREHRRSATGTCRMRRQIFAGVRLAREG